MKYTSLYIYACDVIVGCLKGFLLKIICWHDLIFTRFLSAIDSQSTAIHRKTQAYQHESTALCRCSLNFKKKPFQFSVARRRAVVCSALMTCVKGDLQ